MVEPYQQRPDIEDKNHKKKSKKNPKRYLQFAQKFPIVIRMAQQPNKGDTAMYEQLKETNRALRSLILEIDRAIDTQMLDIETLEELFHELEIGDYSLMSAVHGAWVEAKEAQEAGTK
jgi:hypothetical protein